MSKIEFKSVNGNGEIVFPFNAAIEARILNDSGIDALVEMNLFADDTLTNKIALLHKKEVAITEEKTFKFFVKADNVLSVNAPTNCWVLCNILQERIIDSGKITRLKYYFQNRGQRRSEYTFAESAEHSGQITVIVDDICFAREGRDYRLRGDGRGIIFHPTREPHENADVLIILDKGIL